jgi:hypothetical protein
MTLKYAYTITKDAAGKPFWNKVGVAFDNRDGSINVRLFGLPVNGELQIREYTPQESQGKPAPYTAPKAQVKNHGEAPDDDDIPF